MHIGHDYWRPGTGSQDTYRICFHPGLLQRHALQRWNLCYDSHPHHNAHLRLRHEFRYVVSSIVGIRKFAKVLLCRLSLTNRTVQRPRHAVFWMVGSRPPGVGYPVELDHCLLRICDAAHINQLGKRGSTQHYHLSRNRCPPYLLRYLHQLHHRQAYSERAISASTMESREIRHADQHHLCAFLNAVSPASKTARLVIQD